MSKRVTHWGNGITSRNIFTIKTYKHLDCSSPESYPMTPPKTPSTTSKPVEEEIKRVLWAYHDDYGNTLSEWKDYPASEDLILAPELVSAIQSLIDKQVLEGRIDELGGVQTEYGGRFVALTYTGSDPNKALPTPLTIPERINVLRGMQGLPAQNKDALQTNNKEKK